MAPLVTLLTDFGDADGFVGAMKGVIYARCPNVRIADLAHHVSRGDIQKASRVLLRTVKHFPPKTVHCVAVDPSTGVHQRAVAVRSGGHVFVAPDNGVLWPILCSLGGTHEVRSIENSAYMNTSVHETFRGRDVLAPTAAMLAAGEPFEQVGEWLPQLTELAAPACVKTLQGWCGAVIEIDGFGNLVTNIETAALPSRYEVEVSGVSLLGPVEGYGSVDVGELLVSNGCDGTIEISLRDGSAAEKLGVGVGEPVSCVLRDDERES